MSEDKQLTLKQRKWIKEYLECNNATEAAMRVYDCKDRDSARQIGYENLIKLDFGELMEEGGITDARLKDVLDQGLKSTRVKTSMTEPDRIVEDMPTRHKYLETALKLKKRLSDKQLDVTVPIQIVFNLDEIIGLSHTTAETTDSDAGAIQPTV